jgi:hypothetical protein
MRPIYSNAPPPNVRRALDVLNLRTFFARDSSVTPNHTRVFAIDAESTLTGEELIALHHLGKLTPGGT